jgi:hypothetical protein
MRGIFSSDAWIYEGSRLMTTKFPVRENLGPRGGNSFEATSRAVSNSRAAL